jgi:hypothetical protein
MAALQAANSPVPAPVPIRALVDTGASCSCVDPSVLTSLGLTPTGSARINTPSNGSEPVDLPQYDVALIIPPATPGQSPLIFPIIPVVASQLRAQGIEALIGRDILSHCILVYNGTVNFFSLAF